MANFDIFASAVDRGLLDRSYQGVNLASLVRGSSLFQLSGATQDILSPDTGFVDQLRKIVLPSIEETFSLPTSRVVIEDKTTAVLLADTDDPREGLTRKRVFMEAWFTQETTLERVGQSANGSGGVEIPKSLCAITWGIIHDVKFVDTGEEIRQTLKYETGGMVQYFREPRDGGDRDTGYVSSFVSSESPAKARMDPTRLVPQLTVSGPLPTIREAEDGLTAMRAIESSAGNCLLALQELSLQNLPCNWVVRKQPAKWRRESGVSRSRRERNALLRVPRSDDRPRYVFMTPEQIRAYFLRGTSLGGEWEIGSHPRKEVKRTYHHEKYEKSGLRGTTIIIPATWCGPEEAVVKNTHATVMLSM